MRFFAATLALACLFAGSRADATAQRAPTRGELLYSTHCIACHSQQIHWRDRHVARNWESLRTQVRKWQANANLNWSEEDIEAVTRHLNDTVYRFPSRVAKRQRQLVSPNT